MDSIDPRVSGIWSQDTRQTIDTPDIRDGKREKFESRKKSATRIESNRKFRRKGRGKGDGTGQRSGVIDRRARMIRNVSIIPSVTEQR